MNTLFARTLVWLIATVILTFLATIAAAALDSEPGEQPRRGPFGLLVNLQLGEARHAWESGGAPELRKTLDRFRAVTENEGILTNSEGRDLMTGQMREDLRKDSRSASGSFFRRGRTVLARQSDDGRFIYFLSVRRGGAVRWFFQPGIQLTILAVLTALSYAFARWLTDPVRRLQRAVDGFGRGDFQARVQSQRRDEIGQLARTFDLMADRIVTLLSAERRLLLDISHELRSPLTRLGLAVELARTGDNVTVHLDRIAREADRLNSLAGELLQVTRAEGDEQRMRREAVSLDQLVGSVVADVAIEAESRGCRLEWGQREPVDFGGDPELLRRSFENVIRNAVRYTEPGTSVVISVRRAGSEICITVRDHGPGVPPNALERIFDAFYRVDPDRNRASGGVGLGLAIARRAVELHKGHISATNANPGLQVEITLPAKGMAGKEL